jgi:hypothetical protein
VIEAGLHGWSDLALSSYVHFNLASGMSGVAFNIIDHFYLITSDDRQALVTPKR